MPATIISAKDPVLNEKENFWSHGAYVLVKETGDKQINKVSLDIANSKSIRG